MGEGIAIGRSFALQTNDQIDGNKEMIAYGLMNIVGSMTSCYLTTGPFSKTAVNFNAGCKTPMANIVQSMCMLLVLLVLAPLFSYTPQVALSAIIISAMLGLVKYKKAYHLFKTDKFDFLICMSAFFGVSFISMDMGLMISVGLALIRALLHTARPPICKLGKIPNSNLYRDLEQYPGATGVPGFLILKLGSPIYFSSSTYINERILRWVRHEQAKPAQVNDIEYVLLEFGGVTAIDNTGVESLFEVRRNLESMRIKIILINPRINVMDKLILTKFIEKIGKDAVFLSTEDAIDACRSSLQRSDQQGNEEGMYGYSRF
ncbi:putative sulfate transporter 3.5 [Orobanche hederae]